jgi:hypothetical protein
MHVDILDGARTIAVQLGSDGMEHTQADLHIAPTWHRAWFFDANGWRLRPQLAGVAAVSPLRGSPGGSRS